MAKFTLFLIAFHFSIMKLNAQTFFPPKKYPSRAYINPMDFPISLAGNFGECRPNHFHSGIDIRTNKVENQLVHAIENGFVSRVKIEAGGFGNAIYITHPDGFTSLYAHLNRFYPELEQYVRKEQYQMKSWKIDIYLKPHQFPVRQGKLIAWSGNTGSSEAPHLHMEIRNTKTEAPLNPLLFYAGLPDTKAPFVKQLALYDGAKSIYEQQATLISVSKQGNIYKPINSLLKVNASKAFIGINGDDYMENALGTLGIYEMRMYVNNVPFFGWQHDDLSYDVTRYMNAMADYKTKKNRGPWIQLCYKLPNNKLSMYKDFSGDHGMIDLSNGEIKHVKVLVLDTKMNTNVLEFDLQGLPVSNASACENYFVAGKKNQFKKSDIEFLLPEDALYDNVCFKYNVKPSSNNYSSIYQLHFPYVPVHSYFDLKLKPKQTIPTSLRDKVAIQRYPFGTEKNKKGKAANYIDGFFMTSIRDFGEYELVIDQQAPQITTTLKDQTNISKLKRLSFTIKEETTSVKTCQATIDGQWLRMVQKGDAFYYELDEYFPSGTHNFVITATDENNNMSTLLFTLTR